VNLIVTYINYTKVIHLVVTISTIAIDDTVAYINLAIALYSIIPLSSLLIIASLYELCNMLIEGDYFLSFNITNL
jgi:hypothetical protein